MNQINIYRKYKLRLSRSEMEVTMRLLYLYMSSRPSEDLHTLGICHRVLALGQRLQGRYISLTAGNRTVCTISLNASEASNLVEVLSAVPTGGLGVLERSVIYHINSEIGL